MSLRPLPGYPMPVGEKYKVNADYLGPASYVNGTGDKVSAQGSGMTLGGLDKLDGSGSVSGTYFTRTFYPAAATTASTAQPGANAYVYVRWYVLSSGAEVTNATNLSAEIVRVTIDAV